MDMESVEVSEWGEGEVSEWGEGTGILEELTVSVPGKDNFLQNHSQKLSNFA